MAESFRTNLVNVARAYKDSLGIKVSDTSLRERLTENPYFPSLYALSNTFEKFHIEHTACKVDEENIDRLQTPFIAYLRNQSTGKDFVTVTSISEKEVTYIAGKKKPETISKEDFRKNWLGIVLQAAPDEHSGEKDYAVKRKKEIAHKNQSSALIVTASLLFLGAVNFFLQTVAASVWLSASALFLIKCLGVAATVLLLIYEADKSNAFVRSICTAGRQTNCEAVLGSKASRVLGMSWSEAGFFYFAGTLLFLLMPFIDFSQKTFVLAVANGIAAPYMLFSIYYQWRVVKQWCPLCLTVQAVLAAGLAWSIINVWTQTIALPDGVILLPVAWSLLLPVVLWYVLKPLLAKAKEAPLYKAAYKSLLYNPETFHHLLQQQASAPEGYEGIGITLGNPEAKNTIIKVCNPYCGPCAKAHPVLDEIVHNHPDVKLKLIFTATNEEKDVRGIAAKHILALCRKYPEKKSVILDDWYLAKKKDSATADKYEAYSKKYQLNGEIKEEAGEIEKMKVWCDKAEITFTPTIYVNGYRLPEKYRIEELKYIL